MANNPAPPGAARRDRSGWPRLALGILRVGLSVLGMIFVLRLAQGSDPGAALRALPAWSLAVPLLAMLTNTALLALRHRLALGALGLRLPFTGLLSLHLQSSFAGLLLPRGGADLVRLTALGRATGAVESVVAAGALLRLTDLVTWAGFLLFFLASGPWPGLGLLELGAAVFVGLAVTVVLGAVLLRAAGRWSGPRVARLPWIGPRILAFAAALSLGLRQRGLGLRVALLGLPMAGINVLSVSALLEAAGAELGLARAFGLVPAMDAALSLPITLGGVGVREAIFVLVGGSLGLTEPASLAVAWLRWSGEIGRGLIGGLLALVTGAPRLGRTAGAGPAGADRGLGAQQADPPLSS